MIKRNLVALLSWRKGLVVGSPILTRESRQGIVSKITSKKWCILIGKGHEVKIAPDDLFPLEWNDLVEDWRHRKSSRGPDIPLCDKDA